MLLSRYTHFIIFVAAHAFFSCTTRTVENYTALTDVNLITMESERILANQTILMKDDIIVEYGHSDDITIPPGAKIVSGTGKFALPGLSDMHMHIDHKDILSVNLAYGVTTVMNYRGLPEHLILKEESRQNLIISPNIYTTGDYMEGFPATFPGNLSFKEPTESRASVREQKRNGYDFIKVYRNLDTVLHRAICEEASANQMVVVGHLSPEISLEQSLKSGQKLIAHTEELMYFFRNKNDTARIGDLVKLLNRYQVTYSPNLCIFRSIIDQVERIDSINSQAHMKYLHPALLQSWRKENNYHHRRGQDFADFMKERFEFLKLVTKELHDSGLQVLASTDAPTAGSFPGLAVHQELEELVRIGLTPYEALRTATVEPGLFIGENTSDSIPFGFIRPGYRADILVLDKNPFQIISNSRSIRGVFKNGKWYSSDILQKELDSLSNRYAILDPIVKKIESNFKNGEVKNASQLFYEQRGIGNDDLLMGYYTTVFLGYQYLYEKGQLTNNLENATKAVELFKIYSESFPKMHGSYYFLGLAYKAQQDTVNAVRNFKKSMDLHAYNPYARKELIEMGVKPDELQP